MQNVFMEQFKKRLLKGVLVGGAIILFMLLSPIITKTNPFSQLPWYIVPVVLILCVFYGTGWYFAFNLIKRAWRKALRVSRDATIWQALTGHGIIIGLLYSMLCFIGGCIIAVVVGNYFMLRDFLLARQGKPPVSLKYKFDSDLEYEDWTRDLLAMEAAVEYSDNANGASEEQRLNNKIGMENIKNGYAGTVTTTVDEDGKKIKKNTTIY